MRSRRGWQFVPHANQPGNIVRRIHGTEYSKREGGPSPVHQYVVSGPQCVRRQYRKSAGFGQVFDNVIFALNLGRHQLFSCIPQEEDDSQAEKLPQKNPHLFSREEKGLLFSFERKKKEQFSLADGKARLRNMRI